MGNDRICEAQWDADSRSFDRVATLYDRYRPGYPRRLISTLLQITNTPPDGFILEIGSGTGKATLPLARRGFAIHCIEPGEHLAAVAARKLKRFPKVTFEISRFEKSPLPVAKYDLVVSAQAFHWVPKEEGLSRVAKSLKPGGFVALFWNMVPGLTGKLFTEIEIVYDQVVPELKGPENHLDLIKQRERDIDQSGLFEPIVTRQFPWSKRYNIRQYLGLLNTYSDHLRLPEETRQLLFDRLAETIQKHGSTIEKPYFAVLYVARKAM